MSTTNMNRVNNPCPSILTQSMNRYINREKERIKRYQKELLKGLVTIGGTVNHD